MTTKTGLDLLRAPFPKELIGKLPKPTAQQTKDVKENYRLGIRCKLCGAWHHKDVVHLDYVGHAALTDRLLDCDPNWNWEPLGIDERGQPIISKDGMWIRLTVCGVSRLGFGNADGKTGGDAIKEIIGDALRNAAMRFGAALDLWSKVDLHYDDNDQEKIIDQEIDTRDYVNEINACVDKAALDALAVEIPTNKRVGEVKKAYIAKLEALTKKEIVKNEPSTV